MSGQKITEVAGVRVRLDHTDDLYTTLRPGDEGTVRFIDSTGTIHVRWDDGSTLGLIAAAGDHWTVLP